MFRCFLSTCVFVSITCIAQAESPHPENLAEQLGYPPGTKLLIVHADDVGMSHSVNVATIEAFQHGMIRTGSVMVPCPWFPEIAAYAREHPEADLGLHLTLTSEWKYYRWRPVAPAAAVPGLVDEQGFMWQKVKDVVEHATPEEVERELRAQIERALAFGMKPTHLDTHMGTVYAKPEFFEVYHRLGLEYGIPVMLINPRPLMIAVYRKAGYPLTDEWVEFVRQSPMPKLDVLVTGIDAEGTVESRREAYLNFLKHVQPGVTQLIVHLGMDDPELQAITGSWRDRYGDFLVFTDPGTRAVMKELNIQTIGWREIQRLMPPAGRE